MARAEREDAGGMSGRIVLAPGQKKEVCRGPSRARSKARGPLRQDSGLTLGGKILFLRSLNGVRFALCSTGAVAS